MRGCTLWTLIISVLTEDRPSKYLEQMSATRFTERKFENSRLLLAFQVLSKLEYIFPPLLLILLPGAVLFGRWVKSHEVSGDGDPKAAQVTRQKAGVGRREGPRKESETSVWPSRTHSVYSHQDTRPLRLDTPESRSPEFAVELAKDLWWCIGTGATTWLLAAKGVCRPFSAEGLDMRFISR